MQPFCLFCASTTELIGNTMATVTFAVYCCKYV